MTRPSARSILAAYPGSLITCPASPVGSGKLAMSISSVSIPGRFDNSWTISRAACALIRPCRVVPRITGMNRGRPFSISITIQFGRSSEIAAIVTAIRCLRIVLIASFGET